MIYINELKSMYRLKRNVIFQKMMNYPKLSVNDDLKIDWDDHHLVVFHFFRGDGKLI